MCEGLTVPAAERDWDWSGNARRRLRLVAAVLERKGRVCHLCRLPGATTADHVTPWAHGGRNVLENLEPAHGGCNSARRCQPLPDWFARHPIRRHPALTPSRDW